MAGAQQAFQPSAYRPKKPGPNRFAHVQNTKYGMGDNYGVGSKNKVGKIRDMATAGYVRVSKKGLKKPPKSLA